MALPAIRHRAGKEICQSGPLAPTWFFSSQLVPRQNPMEMTKKGKVGSTSLLKRIVPCFHQQISRRTAGREKAVALAKSAAQNRSNANPQAHQSGLVSRF